MADFPIFPSVVGLPAGRPIEEDDLQPSTNDLEPSQDVQEDGGAPQDLQDDRPLVDTIRFNQNLVSLVDQGELANFGRELKDLISSDINSMTGWTQILRTAMEYLGIENVDGGQTDPLGNSTIKSGALLDSLLKSSSQFILEFFQQSKVAEVKVIKQSEPDDDVVSENLSEKINYYLADVDEGFLPDKYTAGNWLILAGSVFDKTWYDPLEEMTLTRYVKPGDLIVDNAMSSLSDCRRITHRFTLTERDYKKKVAAGIYANADLNADALSSEQANIITQYVSQVEGVNREQSNVNDRDKQYTFYETQCYYSFPDIDGSDATLPYLATISAESGKPVSLYFDWEKMNRKRKRKKRYTHIQYMQGFGIFGYGLAHLALSFAVLATKLLQESVTSTELSNRPWVFTTADINQDQSVKYPQVGDILKLDILGPNIGQMFYSPPFKDASPVILQLMEKAETVVSSLSLSTSMKIEDMQLNAPVGTTLALLLEWHKLPSSIMIRIYRALCEEFKLIYETMAANAPSANENIQPQMWGPYQVVAEEFRTNFKLVPVIDPNLTSTTIKILMYDKLLQVAAQFPQLHNQYNLLKSYYNTLKVPNVDEILIAPQPEEPVKSADPVTENAHAIEGKPIEVEITDDHESHIIVHMNMYQQMSQDPNLQDKAPALHAHIVKHLSAKYLLEMQNKMGHPLPQEETTPEEKNQIAMAAAQVITQMDQQQAQQNPPPIDPGAVGMAEVEAMKENNQLRHQVDVKKLDLDATKIEQESRDKELSAQTEAYKTQAQLNIKERELALKEREQTLKEKEFEIQYGHLLTPPPDEPHEHEEQKAEIDPEMPEPETVHNRESPIDPYFIPHPHD